MNGMAEGLAVAAPRAPATALPRTLRQALCVGALCVTDFAAVLTACAAAAAERALLQKWVSLAELTLFSFVEGAGYLFTIVAIGMLLRGLYSRREPFWETVRLLINTVFLSLLVSVAALYLLKFAATIPRSLMVLAGLNLIVLAPLLRVVAVHALRWCGVWGRFVAVVGKAHQAQAVARDLERDVMLGYRVVAIQPIPEGVERGLIGDAEYPPCVEEVVVVAPDGAPEVLPALVNAAQRTVATVTVVPEFVDLPFAARMTRCLFDSRRMLLTSRNLLRDPGNVIMKRVFDFTLSMVMTALALPLLAAIALAIRLDSRGPAIFSQVRMGRRGRRFPCLKFRTMHVDAEARLAKLLAENAELRDEWERFHKLKDDPRVTRVGRWLRRTSLDELPQLFNVILGQMSLVGPRPLPDYHYAKMEEPYCSDYMAVMPGITGLWQVSGRSESDLQQMTLLNSWYARNWSLWLDLTLLLRTIPVVLSHRGAY